MEKVSKRPDNHADGVIVFGWLGVSFLGFAAIFFVMCLVPGGLVSALLCVPLIALLFLLPAFGFWVVSLIYAPRWVASLVRFADSQGWGVGEIGPRLAGLCLFIPIVNLYLPFSLLRRFCRHFESAGSIMIAIYALQGAAIALLGLAVYIVATSRVVVGAPNGGILFRMQTNPGVALTTLALAFLVTILWLKIVSAISRRQKAIASGRTGKPL